VGRLPAPNGVAFRHPRSAIFRATAASHARLPWEDLLEGLVWLSGCLEPRCSFGAICRRPAPLLAPGS